MNSLLSPQESFELAMVIRNAVDTDGTDVLNDGKDDFDIRVVSLQTPRKIGRTAGTHLRLARARSGILAAAATYFQDEACTGLPLRHIKVGVEGEVSANFDGSMNANDYALPPHYASALKEDIVDSVSNLQ